MPAYKGKLFGVLLRRGQRGNSSTSVEWSLTIRTLFPDKVASDGLKQFDKITFQVDNALLLEYLNKVSVPSLIMNLWWLCLIWAGHFVCR